MPRIPSVIAVIALTSFISVGAARAEVQVVRIGETFGLTHLPSYIVEDLHLIEKHAAKRGLDGVKVSVTRVGNGNVVTDLLLSGNVEVAITGVIPFMVLWDKTRGPQKVRAIASMSECNVFLFSADPKISTIDDYTTVDRIAMTDVKSTTWALLLQMAAAKKYGWEQRQKFEPLSVAMANGEATAAMLSGKTEVKSHMTMLPFSERRADDRAHQDRVELPRHPRQPLFRGRRLLDGEIRLGESQCFCSRRRRVRRSDGFHQRTIRKRRRRSTTSTSRKRAVSRPCSR